MGCDIHIVAERFVDGKYEAVKDVAFAEGVAPFDWRSYGMFGFLADVRNYSDVTPIAAQRGLPHELSIEAQHFVDGGYHSHSWLSVEELRRFDYDAEMEDRRVCRQLGPNLWSGACTADPREGCATTYREFLGEAFLRDLERLVACGAVRVVFCFDC